MTVTQYLTSMISVPTVKSMQMDGKAVGLPESLATIPADIGLVPSVCPHVTGQLNGLGKYSIAVLACVHLPWKQPAQDGKKGNTMGRKQLNDS